MIREAGDAIEIIEMEDANLTVRITRPAEEQNPEDRQFLINVPRGSVIQKSVHPRTVYDHRGRRFEKPPRRYVLMKGGGRSEFPVRCVNEKGPHIPGELPCWFTHALFYVVGCAERKSA